MKASVHILAGLLMYLEHFGLNEPPFRITPHPEFFFAGAERGATLDALIYAVLAGEGLVKVVGEVGSGKTMLCRVLVERLPANIDSVYIANPAMKPDELMLMIADDLGLASDATHTSAKVRDLQAALLERFAAGRQVVILIDEAHAMPTASLEAVRLLSNLDHGHHKLLQIVLFGQPELDSRLAQQDLRQLRERVTHAFQLAPLKSDDIEAYIEFRMRAAGYRGPELFQTQALKQIYIESEGLTRRINILADKSLMAAFSRGEHLVNAQHVKAAIKDSGFKSLKKRPMMAWVLFMGVLAGGVGASLIQQPNIKMASAPLAAPAPLQSASSAEVFIPSIKLTELLKNKIAQSRYKFNHAEANHIAIMLLVTDREHSEDLEKYFMQISQLLPKDQLLIYPAEIRGKKGWGLVYGLFTDKASAQVAMLALPDRLKKNKPILRTVAGMRDELWNL
ncbi:AAA family ATPase [Iodobacter sp. CM08]|uniref:ExeA family protein n=1 Tax=Iodobacter sp. CM08 TaxID=3085902 RepID=UPI00298139E3|nr:AAA family ATPase [Iodobacter sp. CM08]MDW5415451.1 AAA family ATPase [Iodobacter sp. CM08]